MDTYMAGSGAEMVREAEQLGARAREASSTSSRDEGADLDTWGWLAMTLRVVITIRDPKQCFILC